MLNKKSRYENLMDELEKESSSLVDLKTELSKLGKDIKTSNEKVSSYLKKRGN